MERVLKDKRVLVTGGAGFIGSNLTDSLLGNGNSVVCLDNFSTGKYSNIKPYINNAAFTLIEGDIRNYDDCCKALEGVDMVFHQAALGSVPRSIKDPVSTIDVNIGGFTRILFAAKEKKIKRFIYAASSSTYGDSGELPKVEENIGKPLSPYAITKYADELIASNFSALYGIEVIGLRYFNVFGPNQDPEGEYAAVIPKFIRKLMKREAPVIFGDGSVSRDFTVIGNVIQANHLAALTDDPNAVGQVYNIANGQRTSLIQLFEMIRRFAAELDPEIAKIEPLFGPERDGDIKHSFASVEKAVRLLKYQPACTVEQGLRDDVRWFWKDL